MPAGFAPQRGDPQNPPNDRGHSRNMFSGDSLQRQIPADSAMCVNKVSQRHSPRIKSHFTLYTTPRQHSSIT
jgi:hypothetical protein